MKERNKRIRNIVIVILPVLFIILSMLSTLAWAKEDALIDKTNISVDDKIEEVEQRIAEERYRLRLQEAEECLEKGDRYYSQNKLSEALGEWYAAFAILELIKDVDVDSTVKARTILEQEVRTRLKVKENIEDPERLAQIDKRVQEILGEKAKKEQAPEVKKQIKEVAAAVVPKQENVSLQDLEVMKKNRQAIEDMISQEMVANRKPQIEESVTPQVSIEQIAQGERLKQELEAKQLLAQQEAQKRKEQELARQNEQLKREIEESMLHQKSSEAKEQVRLKQEAQEKHKEELARQKKEAKLAKEFKEQNEALIAGQLAKEEEEAKVLKAQTEAKQSQNVKIRAQEEAKLEEVNRQLRKMESQDEVKPVKQVAKKVKSGAGTVSAKEPTAAKGKDKFDTIDRFLKSYENRCID